MQLWAHLPVAGMTVMFFTRALCQLQDEEIDRLLRAAYGSQLDADGWQVSQQTAAADAVAAAEAADTAAALDSSVAELAYVPPAFEAHTLDGEVCTCG